MLVLRRERERTVLRAKSDGYQINGFPSGARSNQSIAHTSRGKTPRERLKRLSDGMANGHNVAPCEFLAEARFHR